MNEFLPKKIENNNEQAVSKDILFKRVYKTNALKNKQNELIKGNNIKININQDVKAEIKLSGLENKIKSITKINNIKSMEFKLIPITILESSPPKLGEVELSLNVNGKTNLKLCIINGYNGEITFIPGLDMFQKSTITEILDSLK